MKKILVTGANGHLGRKLIAAVQGTHNVRAAVRSERAARMLDGYPEVETVQVDYTSRQDMAHAMAEVDVVVHLVGILKETSNSTYSQAHEATCETLVQCAQQLPNAPSFVYLSILGSHSASNNACLRSKGRAEEILLESDCPTTVLQVPMVLGEDDYATRALRGRAWRRLNFSFRPASLEQPIYAGDVVAAIQQSFDVALGHLKLAGPTSLTRAELFRRAARSVGRTTTVVGLPMWLGLAFAGLLERLSANPPVTRAMLEVLDHDDVVDANVAIDALKLELTSLDETLGRLLND